MKAIDLCAFSGAVDSGKTHQQRLSVFDWIGHDSDLLYFIDRLQAASSLSAGWLAGGALGQGSDSSQGHSRANNRGYADQNRSTALLFGRRQRCSRRSRNRKTRGGGGFRRSRPDWLLGLGWRWLRRRRRLLRLGLPSGLRDNGLMLASARAVRQGFHAYRRRVRMTGGLHLRRRLLRAGEGCTARNQQGKRETSANQMGGDALGNTIGDFHISSPTA
jgi:hypothetical protein